MIAPSSQNPTAGRRGFSLIELLISMTITSVILLVMLSLTATVADTWRKSRNKLFSNATARGAFERIATDLDSAYFVSRLENAEWFRVLPDKSGLANGVVASGEDPTWLMFFTSPTDRSSDAPGDVVTMSYRLVEQDPVEENGDFPLYSLYRAFPVDYANIDNAAKVTFDEVLGKPDLTAYWKSGAGEAFSRDSAYLLATNVVDFQVVPMLRDATGKLVKVAPGTEVSVTSEGVVANGVNLSANGVGALLYGVEVNLTVLDEGAIERVRDGTYEGTEPEEFLQKRSRTYSRFIKLLPESELDLAI
ncbi:PulJ/GspJ family protein [Sulfuriroseicoccus oceanibius]|uniref:Prepilin-type N-terminal cleavage/methylation domain-containing protein n=1 Tax=Sulfuriroseicoccus oceanibius TaxID=2707525 RepID=A0A6B3L5B4_9BACT|nr:prepilin-type N-terminal cleavage/methylation domain-containing protein [Sulfuriroseicoccus oceanibius]QQL44295.1 prepilin-type N-terminal cleavage/methylation domain-containing protein [Sulfuriroseicoccus oceanibius]